MPTDEQRLVVSLEARINQLERGLKRAQQTTDRSMSRIERRSGRAAQSMDRSFQRATSRIGDSIRTMAEGAIPGGMGGISGLARGGGIVGLLVGAGAGGALMQTRRITRQFADLSREARRANVDLETFQEFQSIARRFNIGADAMTDALKELQIRADEFATTGAGPAAEAFQRLGFSGQQVARQLQDPADMFGQILERVRELDRAAQTRVLDEIFGGTGAEQVAALLGTSADEIRRMREEARRTGEVVDRELVERGKELSGEIARLETAIGNNLKLAFGEAGLGFQSFYASALRGLNDLIQKATEFGTALSLARPGGALNVGDGIIAGPDAFNRLGGGRDIQRLTVGVGGGGGAMGPQTVAGLLQSRVAHDRVVLDGLDQRAAAAAAAVLADPRLANITITSAVRSETYNRSVGGAANSRHLPRMGASAIDFAGIQSDAQRRILAEALRDAGFGGIGTYEGAHLHADFGPQRYWRRGAAPSWWADFTGTAGTPVPGARNNMVDGPLDARDERRRAEAAEAAADAEQRLNEIMSQGQVIRERNATALERYVTGLEEASRLLQAGAIDHDTYQREVDRLATAYDKATEATDRLANTTPKVESASASAAQTLGGGLVDTLFSLAEDGANAEQQLKRLALQMARMVAMGALFGQGPFGQIFGGGILGLGGGASASAMGNVVGPGGPIPLRHYAKGGVARSPHVALFGEGSQAEAYVPLPDGRSIPVTMRIPDTIRAPSVPQPMAAVGARNPVTIIDKRRADAPDLKQERRQGPDGTEEILITLEDRFEDFMERSAYSGGRGADAWINTFGMTRRPR